MLLKKLLRQAVWNKNKTEVNWSTVQLIDSQKEIWGIQAMNHYFYNGLSGMLLLFYVLNKTKKNEEIEKAYNVLKRMLFEYTDIGNQNRSRLDSQNTGLYEGEGSVAYVYLILYQISKEQEYLNYAVKHSEIIEKLIIEDIHYDLLSGNAGAAWLFILMYQETMNYKYIEAAEKAIDKLVQSAEPQEVGIGWTVEKGVSPMTGMAHGNSGMLMPVIALWKYTGKEIYEKLAIQIWEYEEHLYDKRINNWIDVRKEDIKDEVGAVAWCHGAAGILYSRVICYEMVEDKEWKDRLKKDILRAYTKVKKYWKRDSFSLCHGVYGNVWILKICEERMLINKSVKSNRISVNKKIFLLNQEKINPGCMSGYGGIILYLLCNSEIYDEGKGECLLNYLQ